MVVKKLQESIAASSEDSNGESKSKKRILVLLPRCYVQKIIPNNTQKQRKTVQISDEDEVSPHCCYPIVSIMIVC